MANAGSGSGNQVKYTCKYLHNSFSPLIIGGGVPSFEREGAYMAGELQAHRAHLAAAQNLRYGVLCFQSNQRMHPICMHVIMCRASLLEFHASLEESIRETEARLQELRKASSSQCGLDQQQAGEHQIAPLLQIPPITLPVSRMVV